MRQLILSPRPLNTGLVSSGISLTPWVEGALLALFGNPSKYGVTIKIPYRVDVLLHRPASQTESAFIVRSAETSLGR